MFKTAYGELKCGLKYIFITLVIKNPCKKCLVRACCTEICNDKKYYLSFCDIDKSISLNRICVLSIIFGLITLIFSIFKIIGG